MSLFKKNPIPVLNLDITPVGWEGPFDAYWSHETERDHSLSYFFQRAKLALKLEDVTGAVQLDSDGSIHRGNYLGIHTIQGTLDLSQEDEPYHIIFDGGEQTLVTLGSNGLFYLCNFPASPSQKSVPIQISHPIYTLNRLYSDLPNQSVNTKLEELIRVLTLFGEDTKLDSVIVSKENQLRVLENKYINFLNHLSLEMFVNQAG